MNNECPKNKIKNFAIIAHIDHGKSTLADRLIEKCGGLDVREMKNQVLDSMDIERERGITIKSQTVRLKYEYKKQIYTLNLVDTPGHADFSYEVNRSLAACEGSLLIIDATQGIEAQTMANLYQAMANNHIIIPVLNKIDLPTSDVARIHSQLDSIGISSSESLEISAKAGIGIDALLDAIIERIPSPQGSDDKKLKCLLIDSWYDRYIGVVVLFRVFQGSIKIKDKIFMMQKECAHQVDKLGFFTPKKEYVDKINVGEIGFLTASIKGVRDCNVGDTITHANNKCTQALEGFKLSNPVVFCSLFPDDTKDFENMRACIDKIHVNDSSFQYELEQSLALGQGFKCGFLGLLHMEIIQERLEREFDLNLISTMPSVSYRVTDKSKKTYMVCSPEKMPSATNILKIEEPYTITTIIANQNCFGKIMELCSEKRGEQKKIEYKDEIIIMDYEIPLSEIIFDFYDQIKSISSGYATIDWKIDHYRESSVSSVSILVNKKEVTPLSFLVHSSKVIFRAKLICERLKELIPRQLYKVAIQASADGKIVAREDISASGKNVTAKCYGGDVSRKKKLLEKQKKGKKKMKMFGNVEIPKSAFINVLKTSEK